MGWGFPALVFFACLNGPGASGFKCLEFPAMREIKALVRFDCIDCASARGQKKAFPIFFIL